MFAEEVHWKRILTLSDGVVGSATVRRDARPPLRLRGVGELSIPTVAALAARFAAAIEVAFVTLCLPLWESWRCRMASMSSCSAKELAIGTADASLSAEM